jgi:uncharacterized membrane protein YphA (DoxX/SURF4 family)
VDWPARSACPGDAGLHFLSSRVPGRLSVIPGVADYMQAHGVEGRLLPLVILTELGGGLLVLFGLKTRWAAITLLAFAR